MTVLQPTRFTYKADSWTKNFLSHFHVPVCRFLSFKILFIYLLLSLIVLFKGKGLRGRAVPIINIPVEVLHHAPMTTNQ